MNSLIVLGINGCFSSPSRPFIPNLPRWFYHDASAAIVENGRLIAAVEEERLNRVKHTTHFPTSAIRECLQIAGLGGSDIDRVAFFFAEDYTDVELGLQYAEHPSVPLRSARTLLLQNLEDSLEHSFDRSQIRFQRHHNAHAAAAFFHSGFDESLVIVMDGNGESDSISVFLGTGRSIEKLHTYTVAQSLGHFYSSGVQLLGYTLFDEYKVMGLAPYGQARSYARLFEDLYRLQPNGEYDLHTDRLRSHFLASGFEPRRAKAEFTADHRDFARGLQDTLERLALHVIEHWLRLTGQKRLCLAGGVAQNCAMNGAVCRSSSGPSQIFVHPAAHEPSAAIGAAMLTCQEEAESDFQPEALETPYLGATIGEHRRVQDQLHGWSGVLQIERPSDLAEKTAKAVSSGAIVGWMQGRSELGPRALGHRSILADPRDPRASARVNDAIKEREAYRPLAPSVAAESARKYFLLDCEERAYQFMNITGRVRPAYQDLLPSVCHVDGSVRLHTVFPTTSPRFHLLLKTFEAISGFPVLLNTSFNNHAEPIVHNVHDAVNCFLSTGLDAVVIGDFFVRKKPPQEQDWGRIRLCLRSSCAIESCHYPAHSSSGYSVRRTHTGGDHLKISRSTHDALLEASDLDASLLGGIERSTFANEIYTLWTHRMLVARPTE